MNSNNRQTGMTLIEIMIALLIGAFLSAGILQIFIGSKQTYTMQENLSRMQENGRFALEFLAKDIRMAGYWDCMMPSATNNDITGTEGTSGAPDSIVLRGAFVRTRAATDTCGIAVTAAATVACPQTSAPANFYTDNSSIITYSINSNNLRRVTNCNNSTTATDANIVEGIENMQILYGIDTDAAGTANFGTPNYYVAANTAWTAANWAQVVSIRISLLMATLDDNLAAKQVKYTFNGTETTPTDRKIRRVFNTTIAVRNRLQ